MLLFSFSFIGFHLFLSLSFLFVFLFVSLSLSISLSHFSCLFVFSLSLFHHLLPRLPRTLTSQEKKQHLTHNIEGQLLQNSSSSVKKVTSGNSVVITTILLFMQISWQSKLIISCYFENLHVVLLLFYIPSFIYFFSKQRIRVSQNWKWVASISFS